MGGAPRCRTTRNSGTTSPPRLPAPRAPLLGLAFVTISLNLDQILRDKKLSRRAIETLTFFAYPLAASLLTQLPGLSSTALGIGQAILTAGLIALALPSTCRAGGRNAAIPSAGG
jgi:hypothetical protein